MFSLISRFYYTYIYNTHLLIDRISVVKIYFCSQNLSHFMFNMSNNSDCLPYGHFFGRPMTLTLYIHFFSKNALRFSEYVENCCSNTDFCVKTDSQQF